MATTTAQTTQHAAKTPTSPAWALPHKAPGYTPSLAEAKELAQQGNLIPVSRTILADMETPVSAYRKIARGPYSFLLESVEGGDRVGRYSFIGSDPVIVLRLHDGLARLEDRQRRSRRAR